MGRIDAPNFRCIKEKLSMKPLNGWQRIGMILSALWCLVVSGLSYQYAGIIDPYNLPLLYRFSEFLNLPNLGVTHKAVVIILAVTMPIIGAWLLIYGALRTIRWVAAGFKL